jgi:hypothetical protein
MFNSEVTAIVPKEPGLPAIGMSCPSREYADLLAAEQAAKINNATAVAEGEANRA